MPSGVAKASQQQRQRRPAMFWSPLNDWWRAYLAERGRRPVTTEVQAWYSEHADAVWGDQKPQWKEARIHAKCLRSTEQVKNYFRQYRARSKGAAHASEEQKAGRAPLQRGGKAGPGVSEDTGAGTAGTAGAGGDGDEGSGPSSCGYAAEQFGEGLAGPGMLGDQLHASMNPATITTGSIPKVWQQRSVSERFPAGARPQQPFDSSSSAATVDNRDPSTSMVFRPPSLALRTKPLSPFVLTQVKQEQLEGGPHELGQGIHTTHIMGSTPGSPMMSVATKAQSFSCSTKRRHTTEDAYAAPSAGSPVMLRQAASFSHGMHPHLHPNMHAHMQQRYGSHTPRSMAYGMPVIDDGGGCGLPQPLPLSGLPAGYGQEVQGMPMSGSAPSSNPQTARYSPRMSHESHVAAAAAAAHGMPSPWDSRRSSPPISSAQQHHADATHEPVRSPSSGLIGSVDRRLVEHLARDAAARSSYLERSTVSSCGTGGAGGGGGGGGGSAAAAEGPGGLPQRVARSTGALGNAPALMGAGGGTGRGGGFREQPHGVQPQGDAELADWWALAEDEGGHGLVQHGGEPAGGLRMHPGGPFLHRHAMGMADQGGPPGGLRSLSFPMAPGLMMGGQSTGAARRQLQAASQAALASRLRQQGAQLPPLGPSGLPGHESAFHRQARQAQAQAQAQAQGQQSHQSHQNHQGQQQLQQLQQRYSGHYGLGPGLSGNCSSPEPSSEPWPPMHSREHQAPADSGGQRQHSGYHQHHHQEHGHEGGRLAKSDSVGLGSGFQALRVHSTGHGLGELEVSGGAQSEQRWSHQQQQQQQQQQLQQQQHLQHQQQQQQQQQQEWMRQGQMEWECRPEESLVPTGL